MEIIPCTILVQICQYSKISAFVTLYVKIIVLLWLNNFFFSLKEAEFERMEFEPHRSSCEAN